MADFVSSSYKKQNKYFIAKVVKLDSQYTKLHLLKNVCEYV